MRTTNDSRWARVHELPRRPFSKLSRLDLPQTPGVYALYRHGKPVYVGKATRQSLRNRVWKSHRGRGKSMSNSALRRNVAESLGIASASAIKSGAHPIEDDELRRVNDWLDGCEIVWIALDTPEAATALEDALKAENLPPLTKQ